MNPLETIKLMKEFPSQHELQLVSQSTNLRIHPVGPWVLTQEDVLLELANWRHLNRRFFPKQFPFSVESMRNYILNYSIGKKDRLFFIIFDDNRKPLGHLGLSEIQGNSADVDNVMRNPNVTNFFMRDVLAFLLDWSNLELGIQNFGLTVMPDNQRAIDLYLSLGFEFLDSEPKEEKPTNEMLATPKKILPLRMLRTENQNGVFP
jgi:RimJ/RimL family protein N-acetyltransferase